MRPTFLILGASKAGTTSVYEYLGQHPDVYMSEPKEPFFFESEAEYQKGMDFYWARFYAGWNGQRAVGEADASHIYLPSVPLRVKASLPDAKFIVCLREPVERAYSHWWMRYSAGVEDLSFEEAVAADLRRIDAGIRFTGPDGDRLWTWDRREHKTTGRPIFRTYVDRGYYAEQLERWLALFDRPQIAIVFFEELRQDPVRVVRRLWAFLGVDPDRDVEVQAHLAGVRASAVPLVRGLHRAGVARRLPVALRSTARRLLRSPEKKRPMATSVRSSLAQHYEPHNRQLESVVGEKLRHWDG